MVEPVVVAGLTSGRMTAGQSGGDVRKTADAVGRRIGGRHYSEVAANIDSTRKYPHVQLHNGA